MENQLISNITLIVSVLLNAFLAIFSAWSNYKLKYGNMIKSNNKKLQTIETCLLILLKAPDFYHGKKTALEVVNAYNAKVDEAYKINLNIQEPNNETKKHF